MDEVQIALCHMAGNRVSGSSGILTEIMLKVCSDDLECLVKLFASIHLEHHSSTGLAT